MERKASSSLGASSGVDTRFAEYKRAKSYLRDLRDHSNEVPWDAEAWNDRSITKNGEGEEVHEQDGRDLPRDASKTWNDRSIPSRVVTKQIPSARANTKVRI